MKRILLAIITVFSLTPLGASTTPLPEGAPEDAVASVGDQTIRFSQLNTLLNSAPVVGLSLPALGTPQRNQVVVGLLDKAISANLLYLDAIKQGRDQDPQYRKELQVFSDAILGGLYRARYLIGDIEVTPEEVDTYYREQIVAGTELSDRLRTGIEATIRKDKFKQRTATMRDRLREGIEVRLHEENLDVSEDPLRSDSDLVAEYGDHRITWAEVRDEMSLPLNTMSMERRIESLNKRIDAELMAEKGRAAGLEKDPVYLARVGEFRKTRLVNLHRTALIGQLEPDDKTLRDYYEKHKANIEFRERRKILMVVLETRQQADEVKAMIDNGEITIYQAAMEYSIHPDAKQNLGDMGWVAQGTGFPELDKVTFALAPDELGGPVESPAGWHLVKVTDMQEAQFTDIEDEATRKATRRLYLKAALNDYVAGLRKNQFPVVVYDENLKRLFQEEARWIAAKTREMEANPERAEQILDEMQKVVE
jgi:parvulin-like peptidyl-prolyl isomerase